MKVQVGLCEGAGWARDTQPGSWLEEYVLSGDQWSDASLTWKDGCTSQHFAKSMTVSPSLGGVNLNTVMTPAVVPAARRPHLYVPHNMS